MKKTLVVSYTPRIESNTKKLTDFFLETYKQKTKIDFLDLAKNAPDLLLEKNLNLYVKRNFGGVPLSSEETELMKKNDTMMQQVLDADFIILSYPMFNLSLPATVKAWIDAIIQSGKTFLLTDKGYQGLCTEKQALVLMTTGSDHGIDQEKSSNYATDLLKSCFAIIGIPSTHISAYGMNVYPLQVDNILEKAKKEIKIVCDEWYKLAD